LICIDFKRKTITFLISDVKNFKHILLTLVPEEPFIPSNICEELIVLALSIYRQNVNDEKKSQYILYWLLCELFNVIMLMFILNI